jgi:hypothetical protein
MMKHAFDHEDELAAIKSDILCVASKLGKTPTQIEYKRNCSKGMMTIEKIKYRFGGKWTMACLHAGLTPNASQSPPIMRYNEEELLEEFIRVANSLRKLPSAAEFAHSARFSWRPYKDRWGPGWSNVKKALTNLCSNELHFDFSSLDKCSKALHVSGKLDLALPLLNRPQNEMETIILFALLADKLDYRIEACTGAFPDATILDRDGNRIAAEFEYLSSNYLQHGHPLSFDGLCICWRKDIELKGIKILSLEEYVRSGCLKLPLR